MRWMKLEPVIQSEASQMQDNKRDTDVENRLLDSVGEGRAGMIWENNIETCILPYVKQMTSQVWSMKQGTQSQCTGTAQRDGMGRETEGGFGMGGHMYTCDWFMSMYGKKPPQYCKVINFQLK